MDAEGKEMSGIDCISVYEIESGKTMGYYSEGHVDSKLFAETVLEEVEVVIPLEEIQHGYTKVLPLDEDDCSDYVESKIEFRPTPKDGWEPATYWGDF
jgi:hypothetical protein